MCRIHLCFLLVVLFFVTVNSISINKVEVHPPPGAPTLNITGFSWAENLFFDGQGNLFVSDLNTGILWKVFYNDTSSTYDKVPFSQFDKVAGLTLVKTDHHDVTIFAATTLNSNATLVALNPNVTTGTPAIVAGLASMGNGLSVWAPHGEATFFVALSYNYVANQSVVVKVNGSSGEVENMFPGLSGADGVEVWCPGDESESEGCLLYFNEVISGSTMFVYDLDAGKIINQFLPPQPAKAVDDFCLSKDGQTIYAADFVGGTVISFFSNGTSASATVVASGFTNPTAVRRGKGTGFRSTSLYVSEGGGTNTTITDRRVIEIPNVV